MRLAFSALGRGRHTGGYGLGALAHRGRGTGDRWGLMVRRWELPVGRLVGAMWMVECWVVVPAADRGARRMQNLVSSKFLPWAIWFWFSLLSRRKSGCNQVSPLGFPWKRPTPRNTCLLSKEVTNGALRYQRECKGVLISSHPGGVPRWPGQARSASQSVGMGCTEVNDLTRWGRRHQALPPSLPGIGDRPEAPPRRSRAPTWFCHDRELPLTWRKPS